MSTKSIRVTIRTGKRTSITVGDDITFSRTYYARGPKTGEGVRKMEQLTRRVGGIFSTGSGLMRLHTIVVNHMGKPLMVMPGDITSVDHKADTRFKKKEAV